MGPVQEWDLAQCIPSQPALGDLSVCRQAKEEMQGDPPEKTES